MGKGSPGGAWGKEEAIDDRTDRYKIKGDGGSYGGTDET